MQQLHPKITSKDFAARSLRILARAIEDGRVDAGFFNVEVSRMGGSSETEITVCASVEYRSGGTFTRGEWRDAE